MKNDRGFKMPPLWPKTTGMYAGALGFMNRMAPRVYRDEAGEI